MMNDNDGVTLPKDTEWGSYLLTFEADHYELGGLNPKFDIKHVHNAVMDNLKLTEAIADPEMREKIGSYLQN